MKIAYLDCASGVSGDMMLGALVDAGVELGQLNRAISSLGLRGCQLRAEVVKKRGFRATQVRVEYEPENVHRHLHHIAAMIQGSSLTARQKESALRVFTRLAEAEARVHGTTVDKVHFHEVGAADSIADIVGSVVGWDVLGVEQIISSPIPTGGGKIRIAHGECSVPAPATAELLLGVPLVESPVQAELTTPTGAAIVTTLAARFGPLPSMRLERIGYGAGQRDLEHQPNLLRLLIGVAAEPMRDGRVWVVETNLDNTTGELIGHTIDRLWATGALDVYTTAIQMKKNRPGVKLSVLCEADVVSAVEAVLFIETSTLGIRRWPVDRHVLQRQLHAVETPWGRIEGKVGWFADGPPRFAPEFEACRKAALEHQVPLREVYEAAQKAFRPAEVARDP